MAGVASGRFGDSRPYDGVLTRQESNEWRTFENSENSTPSTSSFGDTDDDDCGQRPSELYGKYTWKIHKFSEINKRELRSNAFEVGGYKWYILMYPQGCDVCNHLSLFLCVANHDKLLPGWRHFAQFTMAVVNNKDPKNSKHSDTLHRFRKKEHDWGWKKFIELSKGVDGFLDSGTLTIEAEVQVIRERVDRPFRCLTCKYRRELVCIYLSNVEQICHLFVEERRSKLGNFLEDKARWSSFCAFWLRIDQKTRRSLTREKTDSVLRVIVKHFFVEKEVTSTLVMDALFSGLKTLEGQSKTNKSCRMLMGTDNLPVPVVRVEQEMFVVVDDVLLLLERAALDPLPLKEDRGPPNRMEVRYMKDGSSGDDFSKGSIEHDERRLTELGRRTIEIFVLSHIFSKIEVAYQEAVALKRQDELIREEAAWLETEQKSKRGVADKEKKSKKKQGKQKRNNRKGKDKGRGDYAIANAMDKLDLENLDEGKNSLAEQTKPELVETETFEDFSDVSDTIDHVTELVHPDPEEKESSPVNQDTDTFEVDGVTSALSSVQNGIWEINGLCTVVDDSSSTCSTDSVPSVVTNEGLRSSSRESKQHGRATRNMFGWVNEGSIRSSNARIDVVPLNGLYGSCKTELEPDPAPESLLDQTKKMNQHIVKGQAVSHRTEPSIKHQHDTQSPPKEKTIFSLPKRSTKSTTEAKISVPSTNISIKKPLSDISQLAPLVRKSAGIAVSTRLEPHKPLSPPKLTKRSSAQEVPVMSRPLSSPIVPVPGPRPSTPVISMVQSKPLISRPVSAVECLGPDPILVSHRHLSNANVTMGTSMFTPSTSTSLAYAQPQARSLTSNLLQHHPTPANVIYPPIFGVVNRPSMETDSHALDLYKQVHNKSLYSLPTGLPACKSSQQTHSIVTDEFPHLDIINDLLDDEYGTANTYTGRKTSVSPHLHSQFSNHGDIGMTSDMLEGPSTIPCRLGQPHSSHESVFQPNYTRDFFTQQSLSPLRNGQNQWQAAKSDLSHLNKMALEGGGFTYCIPDYSNLTVNSNNYTVFRPSNGQ